MAFGPPPLTVRVPPACPARVIARGVEGDCTVRYDILASGRTATLAIVSCDSRGFERAMTEAVSRWQYAPDPDRSDVAAVRRGVTATLEFRLTE